MTIEFLPIDIKHDSETCVRFREDSFVASFGDAQKFHEADGQGAARYLIWLRSKAERDPWACVHLWCDGKIVGQIEMGPQKDDARVLNVNLFYLEPSARGSGLGQHLQDYVVAYMRRHLFAKAQLCVSPSNTRAIAYYSKHGWQDLGPHPNLAGVYAMEFVP